MRHNTLIIIRSLCFGGAERVLLETLAKWNYNLSSVTVLQLFGNGEFARMLPPTIPTKIVWEREGDLDFVIRWKLYRLFKKKEKFRERILRAIGDISRFDTIISFTEGLPAIVHLLIAPRAAHNITMVHCDFQRDKSVFKYFGAKICRDFYDFVDDIITVNELAKLSLSLNCARFGFHFASSIKSKTHVVPNPINIERITSLADSPDDFQPGIIRDTSWEDFGKYSCPTIVAVGRLVEVKHYDRLLLLAKELKRRKITNFYIGIIGAGPMRCALETAIRAKRLRSCMRLYGYKDNPYPYIARADVFVHTSDSESFGMSVVEAMVLRTPIVAWKNPAIASLLTDGRGILCDSIPQMADAILQIVNNKEATSEMTARAAQYIEDRSKINSQTLLTKIITNGKQPRH